MASQLSLFGKKPKKSKKKTTAKRKKVTATKVTKAMRAKAKKKGGLVLKKAKRMTGSSNLKADRKRKALAPGKRLSRTGKVYTETRKNRSDKK